MTRFASLCSSAEHMKSSSQSCLGAWEARVTSSPCEHPQGAPGHWAEIAQALNHAEKNPVCYWQCGMGSDPQAGTPARPSDLLLGAPVGTDRVHGWRWWFQAVLAVSVCPLGSVVGCQEFGSPASQQIKQSCLLPSCTLREARGRSLKDGCTFSFCVCLLKHLRCLLNQLDVWLLMRYVLLLCSLEVTLALAFSVSSSYAALSACAAGWKARWASYEMDGAANVQWGRNGVWERMRDHGHKRAALQRAAVTARERRNGRETRICTELFKLMLINNSTYILAFFLWWCFLYTNATVYYIIWFHSLISMVLIVLRYSQQIQFFWKIPPFSSFLLYLWVHWGYIW